MRNLDLDKTFKEVNKNFGDIFKTLLPNAFVRLQKKCGEKENGEEELIGLEIKPSFSGLEVETLSQLSGGQRSLIAISLILALLKY